MTISNYFDISFNSNLISKIETFDRVEIRSISKNPSLNTYNLEELISSIHRDDSFEIEVTGWDDPITLRSRVKQDIEYFDQKIKQSIEYSESIDETEHQYNISLRIQKNSINKHIYDVELLCVYLQELKSHEKLLLFSELVKTNKHIIILDDKYLDSYCITRRISFVGKNHIKTINRNIKYKNECNLDDVSHFINVATYSIKPFDLYDLSSNIDCIESEIKQIQNIISFIYLANISELENNTITWKINGYKSYSIITNTDDIKDNDTYFKIMEWATSGPNLSDKLGIIRNIFTIIPEFDVKTISSDIIISINASHEIYLKENIERYIDQKNKINDAILSFNDRASGIIENYSNMFKNNLLATFSFFASVVLLGLIRGKDPHSLFEGNIGVFTLILVFISTILLVASYTESTKKINRFKISYNNMKDRYLDLLNSDDINRLFNDDKEHTQDICYIKAQITKFSFIWLFINITIVLATVLMMPGSYINYIKIILFIF